jgi:pyruvate dehydrogenase E1 component
VLTLERQIDEFYYLTVTNENYAQSALPDGAEEDVIKGMYRYAAYGESVQVRLLGSGAILREVIAAAKLLKDDWHIGSEVWSVTSFSELARDARAAERDALYPEAGHRDSLAGKIRTAHVAKCLSGQTPIVAATDYVRAVPQLIASYIDAPFVALGTDGFGRSDTRAALRRFFEIDRYHIVVAALAKIDSTKQDAALLCYGISAVSAPWVV